MAEYTVTRPAEAEERAARLAKGPVPESVSALQIRRAIRRAGLKGQVQSWLARADEDTIEDWEYATEIRRVDPMVNSASETLGLTQEQVDDLFRDAAKQ